MRAKLHEGPDQSHPTSSVADRFRAFSPAVGRRGLRQP